MLLHASGAPRSPGRYICRCKKSFNDLQLLMDHAWDDHGDIGVEDWDCWTGWYSAKQSWHIQKRLWERFGIVLRYGEFSQLCRDIVDRRNWRMRREDESGFHYSGRIHGKRVTIIVSKLTGDLLTAIHATSIRRKEGRPRPYEREPTLRELVAEALTEREGRGVCIR